MSEAQEKEVNGPVNMDLNDIALAVRVIDIACERGGFKGQEMQVIGALRGRLAEVVTENAPETAEANEEAVEVEAESVEGAE